MADKLPSAPRILAELQVLLKDPNNGLDDVTELLRRDAGMTARLIRIANGIVYNKGDPVASIEEALARVGFNEVYRLTGMASVMGLVSGPLKFYGVTAQRLRENSLLGGLIMEELAPYAGADARAAYTAGLLRSVGKVALDATAQQDMRYIQPKPVALEGTAAWEREWFGPTNSEVASAVLQRWHFPADVFVPIRDHYLSGLEVEPMPLAKFLHLAAAETEVAGFGLPGEKTYWDSSVEKLQGELELPAETLEGLRARALWRFQTMRAAVA